MYEVILCDVKDRVGTLTFNRPDVGNAFAPETYREVKHALYAFAQDDNVGCIVLTGAGKFFAAGGDIKRFKRQLEAKEYLSEENVLSAGDMALAVRRCPKPVVAMINGAAAGAGASLALACDFRIVTASTRLVLGFINLGLPGDSGAMSSLIHLVGTAKTMEILITGTAVGGEEAMRLGLATKLAEEGKLAEVTYEFARYLAARPLQAIKYQKATLLEFYYAHLRDLHQREADYMVACSKTKDFEEAVNAFLEKRPAQFIGK